MNETSLTLLVDAQNGVETARETLATVYQPYIRYLVRNAGVRDPDDVEDLVQDTLMQMFQMLDRFNRLRVGSLRRWLQVIAYRTVARKKKYNLKVESSQVELLVDPKQLSALDLDSADCADILRVLWQYISNEFSALHLTLFERSIFDQHSPVMLSHELGIPVNVIYLTRSRIMKRLKDVAAELYGIDSVQHYTIRDVPD